MAVDLRQVMAAILTLSMFIMLGNMIKRDHLDPLLEPLPVSPKVQYNALKISKPGMHKLSEISYGPWKELNESPKPCWKKPSFRGEQSKGYIFFSLSHNPEFHASQIANVVVIARHLGATLALPDIRGAKLDERRKFGEIYDVSKFIETLNGIVRVDKNPPAGLSNGRVPTVRVPNKVSTNFIASNIKPIFKTKRALKIVTCFNASTTMKRGNDNKLSNAFECVATFETLNLQPDLQEVVDSMVGTLRSLSQKTRGRFVAVDLRVEMLRKKSCLKSKWCYNGEEIGEFLKKIGFHADTTIYLTQTGWDSSLNALRNVFPNTFTKDAIMPADEKAKYMGSESREYENFIDFYMCTKADVFVPAFPSRFYHSVVGKRIAYGKTQIIVPANNTSASATDYISPYITNKNHSAYSCFC
ncbi:hypothetical protein BUALT_Bualt11G0082300 [Buddleja alternifolia]|uniref:O-fucosyltransferase family protein n=1 Tax=Buddleja alternifolia TaxID=168488 RepID=A0AAV6WUC5_9LAMI|nr:hypothetical protein BUALT_Bualt11G0082300 [Buddleja alternifolia]